MRITGYSDLVGNDTEEMKIRKDELIQHSKNFFGEDAYDEKKANHWVGIRPVSADDIPIIGRSSKFTNLFWNTGHGGRGVTFSLGSGKILSHIMNNEKVDESIDLKSYSPSRFAM